MSEAPPPPSPLPLYADGTAARRTRRSFRYAVAACVLFTFVLWYVDGYLRLELREIQYRMSLTLEEPSARAILRNVVRRQQGEGQEAAPLYVAALADVEEKDAQLPRYEEAYHLDPENPMLLLRYGCALYQAGYLAQARDRFREAAILDAENALPKYLEAAAVFLQNADGQSGETRAKEALALIAEANETRRTVSFPPPYWHESLPAACAWRLQRMEKIIGQCLAPLNAMRKPFVHEVLKRSKTRAGTQALDRLFQMGSRLQRDAAPLGLPQALFGMRLQLDILYARLQIETGRPENGIMPADSPHAAAIEALEKNADRLEKYEHTRSRSIAEHRGALLLSAQYAFITLLWMAGCYLLSVLALAVVKMARREQTGWVPCATRGTLGLMNLGMVMLFSLLMASFLHGYASIDTNTFPQLLFFLLWSLMILSLSGYALLYPSFWLRSHRDDRGVAVMTASLPMTRALLLRQYFGLLVGCYVMLLCAWALVVRLSVGAYPWDFSLLTTDCSDATLAVLRAVRGQL